MISEEINLTMIESEELRKEVSELIDGWYARKLDNDMLYPEEEIRYDLNNLIKDEKIVEEIVKKVLEF